MRLMLTLTLMLLALVAGCGGSAKPEAPKHDFKCDLALLDRKLADAKAHLEAKSYDFALKEAQEARDMVAALRQLLRKDLTDMRDRRGQVLDLYECEVNRRLAEIGASRREEMAKAKAADGKTSKEEPASPPPRADAKQDDAKYEAPRLMKPSGEGERDDPAYVEWRRNYPKWKRMLVEGKGMPPNNWDWEPPMSLGSTTSELFVFALIPILLAALMIGFLKAGQIGPSCLFAVALGLYFWWGFTNYGSTPFAAWVIVVLVVITLIRVALWFIGF